MSILILTPAFYLLPSVLDQPWSPGASHGRADDLLNSKVIMGSMLNATTKYVPVIAAVPLPSTNTS